MKAYIIDPLKGIALVGAASVSSSMATTETVVVEFSKDEKDVPAMLDDHASVVSMNLFVALLCASIVIGSLYWGGKSSSLLVFCEDLFFIYLLPPIIFNAGFSVKKKQFFINFITIMLFGVVGVIKFFKQMNLGLFDMGDFVAIGAIFAATDSVCTLQVLNQDETPLLYSLVFGERVVNDATSVVLFNAIQSFDLTNTSWNCFGVFRKVLVSIYSKHSSGSGCMFQMLSRHAFATLSFVAEIFIFIHVGMDALDIETWGFVNDRPGTSIIVSSVLLALVIIWWSGLMRGVVSMALAYNQEMLVTLSVGSADQVFGLLTKPSIRFLLPHSKVTSMPSGRLSPKSVTKPFLGSSRDSFDDTPMEYSGQAPLAHFLRLQHTPSITTGASLIMPSCGPCLVAGVLFPSFLAPQQKGVNMVYLSCTETLLERDVNKIHALCIGVVLRNANIL
ncbi:Sodium/hydrogen exchanger 4 [Hibiscus syriacus]|uniref:Sodium/hydrogen exchanger 4 n=1 Tax=Hibiscus syriacus TaxID=106335 RepID=A0A6A3B8V8_HIBSY|nr:Sodium/hydrogen exchanger 4 [Hibiscus syriacus]